MKYDALVGIGSLSEYLEIKIIIIRIDEWPTSDVNYTNIYYYIIA